MEAEKTISLQPEFKANEVERKVLLERERRFGEADSLIDAVQSETGEIIHRDEMLFFLSRAGIKTINEDLDNIKMSDVGVEEVVKPSLDNITRIEKNIKSLEELGSEFGHDQSSQVYNLKEIIIQIRVSQDEEEIKNLIAQAKNIFSTNVTGLLNKHYNIASQQDSLGEICTKNGRQLQINLDTNFSGQTWEKINQGPVGFYVKRSVKYGKDEASLVEDSLNAHGRYHNTLGTLVERFSQVMDSFVANNNSQSETYFK